MTSRLFHLAMRTFPRSFRSRYADEMLDVFNARSRDHSLLGSINELSGIAASGLRMRLENARFARPAVAATLTAAMIASIFALRDSRSLDAGGAHRIDFSAHDPAGLFTLSIEDGRPIAATLDRVPLPANRIVAARDSVKILAANGDVAIAMFFDAARGIISWAPRSRTTR